MLMFHIDQKVKVYASCFKLFERSTFVFEFSTWSIQTERDSYMKILTWPNYVIFYPCLSEKAKPTTDKNAINETVNESIEKGKLQVMCKYKLNCVRKFFQPFEIVYFRLKCQHLLFGTLYCFSLRCAWIDSNLWIHSNIQHTYIHINIPIDQARHSFNWPMIIVRFEPISFKWNIFDFEWNNLKIH